MTNRHAVAFKREALRAEIWCQDDSEERLPQKAVQGFRNSKDALKKVVAFWRVDRMARSLKSVWTNLTLVLAK